MTKQQGEIQKRRQSAPAAAGNVGTDVIYEQLRNIVQDGDVYYVAILPDGSQRFYADKNGAIADAKQTGGRVVARPTRPALRSIAAAAGMTAIPTETVLESDSRMTLIQNQYMSLSFVRHDNGEQTVIATVVMRVIGRDIPGVGAASTDEFSGRLASLPFGDRLRRAVELAATRAMNRAISDATGTVTMGTLVVGKEEPPQTQVIRMARERGIPIRDIPGIIGMRIDQVSADNLEAALAAIEAAANSRSNGDDSAAQ